MLTASLGYDDFLYRSQVSLSADGARPLDGAGHDAADRRWGADWDLVMFNNGPGVGTIYAFTSRDDPLEVRKMEDDLAKRLSTSGILGAVPVHLVSIVTLQSGGVDASRRALTRVTPSTFYQGLRPATWVADLRDRRVFTPGLRRPAEAYAIQAAMTAAHSIGPEQAEALHRDSLDRQQAFFRLMQGRQPLVTYALITINVLIFVIMYNDDINNASTLRDFGALSPALVESGQWWRLFTSIFLHASIPHILFNMTSLFAVGTLAERLYGSARYLAIYLGAGLIGSATSFGYAVVSGHTDVLGVGASGAIFGVAGCLLTIRWQESDIIPRRVRLRVSSALLPLVAISLVIAFLTPYVDNSAHVGGLLGGMALSFLFPLPKRAAELSR